MDTTPILKRPKPTDDEDDLFRMQEEFLKNKQQPSAKVIDMRGLMKPANNATSTDAKQTNVATGKVRSRFSELKRLKLQERVSTSQTSGDIINPQIKNETEKNLTKERQDTIHNLQIDPSNVILGNIVEKKYESSKLEFKSSQKYSGMGFPKVFVSSNMKTDTGQSLFWQQITQEEHIVNKAENSQDTNGSSTTEGSVVIEGPWAAEIHQENLERLSQMSKEDIIREKSKLEMTLQPDLIQFLKNRKNKKKKEAESTEKLEKLCVSNEKEAMIITEEKVLTEKTTEKQDDNTSKDNETAHMEIDAVNEEVPEPPKELIKQAKEKGWIHMDSLEANKLKWMQDIPVDNKDQPTPHESYNARFDFNGLLLPYKDESVSLEKGLHHHGEEPERPGYSLQELLQLSRSSTQQQRCTALTTLANIIEKSRKGWYDKALQPAPLTALSQRNLLLLLRFSLDDTSVAVVTASLQALRAFLYSDADEVCLDRLYGFNNYKEPVLHVPRNDVTDTSNLKDHELAQLDAVAALLRTDIVLRIRYILSELRPPPVGVTCALEILIRLARHSNIAPINIASTPYLLDTIIENFMPLSADSLAMHEVINNVYGIPVTAAVRFCRILLCYGGKPVAQRLDRLKIVERIISYVSSDAGKGSFLLSIETLRLWKTLLLHEVAVDSLSGAQLILISQLQLLLTNHNLQHASELACEHAAALIAVASCLTPLRANISVLLSKWISQLPLLISPTWGTTKLIAETLLAVDDASAVKKLVLSKPQVVAKLGSTSNLLSDCVMATDREPSSLPNLGVLTQDGQLQPIVSQQSCIPFLATALNVLLKHSSTEEIQGLFSLEEFCRYLKRLETSDWSLERSWYTRFELFFLTTVVNAAFVVKDKLNTETMYMIWKIAIKLVSSLPADCSSSVKDMLRIALSHEKMHLQIVVNELAKLNLDSNIDDIKMNLNCDVTSMYEQYVASNGEWDQSAMPKDWLYLPLVHIYTKCRNGVRCDDKDRASILILLSLELILPDLIDKLSQSLRFSRLVLVYLCDTLYLNRDVSPLLSRAVSTLLKDNYQKLNFTVDVPGLSSFTDLFTAMCEHFCSTSYGDFGFSMALLVPIAQRHDVHYRKLLWSEHAGSLRYLRLPVEQLVIPLKEYLYPVEEDASLIESYITALVRGIVKQNWCPIPYAIAVHHSAIYIKQSTNLATRMRRQIEKLPNKELSAILLHYESSV